MNLIIIKFQYLIEKLIIAFDNLYKILLTSLPESFSPLVYQSTVQSCLPSSLHSHIIIFYEHNFFLRDFLLFENLWRKHFSFHDLPSNLNYSINKLWIEPMSHKWTNYAVLISKTVQLLCDVKIYLKISIWIETDNQCNMNDN